EGSGRVFAWSIRLSRCRKNSAVPRCAQPLRSAALTTLVKTWAKAVCAQNCRVAYGTSCGCGGGRGARQSRGTWAISCLADLKATPVGDTQSGPGTPKEDC